MFLRSLTQTNQALAAAAFALHREGAILPDTYIVDLDAFQANAKQMKASADAKGVELYFMSKQMGRNPYLCKLLVQLGYPGAVVVDYKEAAVMMENRIPIAHAGHLVQTPDAFLPRLLEYGAGMITVYSVEKAEKINRICEKQGRKQALCLRVLDGGDTVYPGQEGGIRLDDLEGVISALEKLEHVRLTSLTSFPCFLYNQETRRIEPTTNLQTVVQAQRIAQARLGRTLRLNLPSCTQNSLIGKIVELGGSSAEPGSAFIGTTPNNEFGLADETLAIAYVSEISHNHGGRAYCYGGGLYPRGQINSALVGTAPDNAEQMAAIAFPAENIDYTLALQGTAEVGAAVVMCFRPQIFTSRSHVALLEGVQAGSPKLIGLYDSRGRVCE